MELRIGDILVVYSDGLTEAMSAREEFFGEERLRALLADSRASGVEYLGALIVDAVDRFVGDARPHDDLPLIVLRRTGTPPPQA